MKTLPKMHPPELRQLLPKKIPYCSLFFSLGLFLHPVITTAQSCSASPGSGPRISQPTATLLPDGRVLVAGGMVAGKPLASAELYNPTSGTFTATGSMTTARTDQTATLLSNGQVLVAGGAGASSRSLASAELYNPTTGTFTATGSMITARADQTATLLPNGQVLVAGGVDGAAIASAELYNPMTGTFTATGTMGGRWGQVATLLANSQVLVAGGSGCDDFGIVNTAELYNPATGTFTATGSMTTARTDQTATLLPNGQVLVVGGMVEGRSLASAELYNPATGTFTVTGSMTTERYAQVATLLPSGQVLMTGGLGGVMRSYGANPEALASAELYNPATGTFTVTGSMTTERYAQVATLLPSGQVLMTGGVGGATSPYDNYPKASAGALASVELYNPTTRTFTATGSMTTPR